MLARDRLVKFVVGLVEVNDADLIDQDSVLSGEVCASEDRAAVRQFRDLIEPLIRDYCYTDSADFQRAIESKSPAYVEMFRRRCAEPVQQSSTRKRFCEALARITDDEVLDLLPDSAHDSILRAREILAEIPTKKRA